MIERSRQHRGLTALAAVVAIITAVVVLENFGGDALNQLLLYLPGVDKLLHVAQSFLILLVIFYAAGRLTLGHETKLVLSLSLAVGLAVFDEWQQQWVAARSIEIGDVLAGLAGITLAAAVIQRRHTPRLARAAGIGGMVLASAIIFSSFQRTKDYNWGLLAEARGDMSSAHRHFLAAAQSGMRSAQLFNELAWAAAESGAAPAEDAVRFAEEALRLRPGHADTLDTYGWTLHKAGRSREALGPLNEAFEKSPRMYCIHYHLGAAYLALGDHQTARRHLQRQVDEHPHSREAAQAASLLEQIR